MKIISISLIILLCTIQQDTTRIEQLTGQSPNPNNQLQQPAQQAFNRMRDAALLDNIQLTIVSGYRSFERQRQIWNHKYTRYQQLGLSPDAIFDSIVTYSTLPGTSRHHWGTDIDIIDSKVNHSRDLLLTDNYHGNGAFCKLKEWMEQHAQQYGYQLVYTLNAHRTGFNYEPWHYSYAPLSRKRIQHYLAPQDFINFIRNQQILGMDQVSDQRLITYYHQHILGINPELLTN